MDKALLAKIRKCLALAASSNESEAASALAMARKLMDEHGVTEAQIAMAEIEEATARASRTQRPPKWENYLSAAVQQALNVTAFLSALGDRTFVGRGPAPEIATYAFTALFWRLKSARAEYISAHLRRCKPGRKRQRADVFCEAWAAAVYGKIAALMPEKEEDELVGRYLAERYPGLVPVTARASKSQGRSTWNDYARGARAGRTVDIHSPVSGGARQQALT